MTQGQARPITRRKLQQLGLRIIRTARFDKDTFRELKEDRSATGQAIAVLLIVGLSYGLGFSIFSGLQTKSLSPSQLISGTIANMIFTDFAAFIWSATVFLVGTKLFQGKTGFWELARPLFFSAAPGIFFILIAIPVRPIIIATTIIASAWIVSAEFVAITTKMRFNTPRTDLTSVVGLLTPNSTQITRSPASPSPI